MTESSIPNRAPTPVCTLSEALLLNYTINSRDLILK